jgi:hypothetical protein
VIKRLMTKIVIVSILFNAPVSVAMDEPEINETDFYKGIKTGLISGFVPVAGTAYLGLSALGDRLAPLGIGVQGIDNITNAQSFASGVLVGHVVSLAVYARAIGFLTRRFGSYGALGAFLFPPVLVLLKAKLLRKAPINKPH